MKNVFVGRSSEPGDKSAPGRGPFDWWMLTIVMMLLCIGLVMVLSASGIVAEQTYNDKYFFFKRQAVFAGIALVVLCFAAVLPRAVLYRSHYAGLLFALGLMIATLLSPPVNGARRWIQLGFFSVQAMEFVKIAVVLYLAYFMSMKQEMVKTFCRGVLPPAIVTGLFCGLLLLQPDFGSAVVLAVILFFMCIAGGTRLIYLSVALLGACSLAWTLATAAPYRMRRILAFLDPFKDAQDTGYQLVQSLLAIGSGGFFGVGVGASRQKMFYLPEAHNDFIMAVVGEETGFVGITCVMLLFALFFWRCLRTVLRQENLRDRYTAFGLTLIIALGALLNLAVVMGAAPPKGVPMPFLSYGGSSLVATMFCVGLLMNFSRTARSS